MRPCACDHDTADRDRKCLSPLHGVISQVVRPYINTPTRLMGQKFREIRSFTEFLYSPCRTDTRIPGQYIGLASEPVRVISFPNRRLDKLARMQVSVGIGHIMLTRGVFRYTAGFLFLPKSIPPFKGIERI